MPLSVDVERRSVGSISGREKGSPVVKNGVRLFVKVQRGRKRGAGFFCGTGFIEDDSIMDVLTMGVGGNWEPQINTRQRLRTPRNAF
jgi:hypothetical protein